MAITPSAGYLSAPSALLVGLAAGTVCVFAVTVKYRFRLDDSLDVFGVHFVGGVIGTLSIGLLATAAVNPAVEREGTLLGGGVGQLGDQVLGVLAAAAFAFTATWLLAFALHRVLGMRVDAETEFTGLDTVPARRIRLRPRRRTTVTQQTTLQHRRRGDFA